MDQNSILRAISMYMNGVSQSRYGELSTGRNIECLSLKPTAHE